MLLVVCRPSTRTTSRTCRLRHRRLAYGIGIATRSRRLTVTPGALLGCGLSGPFLVPALEPDVPEGKRLHRRGLPGVVRADEDHGTPELYLDVDEALEVADGELWSASAEAVLKIILQDRRVLLLPLELLEFVSRARNPFQAEAVDQVQRT